MTKPSVQPGAIIDGFTIGGVHPQADNFIAGSHVSISSPRVTVAGRLKPPLLTPIFSMLQPYQSLAEIFSPVKLGDGSRAMFEAVGNLFAVTELSVADPFGETFDRLHVAVLVIEDDKAGHPRTLNQDMTLDPRTERRRVPASDRSGAADHHPRADRQTSHHRVADRP